MADGQDVEVVVAVLGIVLASFMVIAVYAARYKRVPPNKAMVVFGRHGPQRPSGPPKPEFKVIRSGGRFIQPIVESFAFLSLEPFTVEDEIADVVVDALAPGLRLAHVGMRATARIADSPDALRLAATNLLDHPQGELKRIVSMTIEGHTRGILGGGPPSMPDHDLTGAVLRASREDLARLGLDLFALVLTRRRS